MNDYPKEMGIKERELLDELKRRFPNINQIDIDRYMHLLQDIRLEAYNNGQTEGFIKGEIHGARNERLKHLGWVPEEGK